jgi:uncharacterized membrane protein YkvA (DUF1232 family)
MLLKNDILILKGKILLALIKKLKDKAKIIKTDLISIYYAFQHPKTWLVPKLIIIFTIGYALSPIDLIPDFIPVLGYLDDLIIVPALILLSIKFIPKDVLTECRIKAQNEPIRFKNNWIFAVIFILIWIGLFLLLSFSVIKLFIKK